MTEHGEKLADVSLNAVTARLQEEPDGKAVKRLVAAREYLAGHSPAEISEEYGWPEQTIYSWLDRFESLDFEDALYDDHPPGRPSELSDSEFEQFRTDVQNPPEDSGFDAEAWSSVLAHAYLQREFDQKFSRRHVRRLLHRVGTS